MEKEKMTVSEILETLKVLEILRGKCSPMSDADVRLKKEYYKKTDELLALLK